PSRCASGERHTRGTRGTPKIAFGAGAGETLPDRHQRRRSFYAAASGGGLSRWCFPPTSFAADETSRAKGFDVPSIASPCAGRDTLKAWIDSRTTREKPVELKSGETLHVDFP